MGYPLADWLVEQGMAEVRTGKARLWVFWPTQSMERAGAYARAYVETLQAYGIDASYTTRLD